MMKRLALSLLLLAAMVGLSPGQPLPQPSQTQVFGAWTSVGRAPNLTAGVATGNTILNFAAPVARVCNTSTVIDAYVKLGVGSGTVATLTGSTLVQAGSCVAFNAFGATYVAAITASSTAVLTTELGTGSPQASRGGAGGGGGGSGTVQSVDATVPAYMTLSGNPITTIGTLAFDFAAQSGNKVFASPSNGSSGAMSMRALVAADIPTLTCSKLSDATALCSSTDAANLTGTVASARLTGSYTGITGVGTIAAGVWQGTTVAVGFGGTGLASGTSGGVPYFSASNTMASSAALTANLPVIGGGAGAAPTVGTRSGNTTAFVTTTGAQTSGDCVKIDASGNHIANGSSCGGGGITQLTGDVTAGPGTGSVAATLVTAQPGAHTWAALQTLSAGASIATGQTLNWNSDLILGRNAAATLQLGAADVDTGPVAQTLRTQGALTGGTSNVAGANFTIAVSPGKGTGSGGSFIVQTAPAGSTGTTPGTLTTALTIASDQTILGAAVIASPIGFTRSTAAVTGIVWSVDHILFRQNSAGSSKVFIENGGGMWLSSTYSMGWSSTADAGATTDLKISRFAAATLQFGAADAAGPVAQTLRSQGVVAGTSNTAGVNLTVDVSPGTGTGVGGSFIVRTAAAGSTGTTQNTLAAALTIDSTKTATFAGLVVTGVGAAGSGGGGYAFVGDTTTGWFRPITGEVYYYSGSSAYLGLPRSSDLFVRMRNTVNLSWTAGDPSGSSDDLILSRFAAATLQFGAADAAAPVAQALRFQGVVAGTSNTAGANATIQASAGTGTGIGGSLIFQVAAAGTTGTTQNSYATALTIKSTGSVTIANWLVGNASGNVAISNIAETGGGNIVPTIDGSGSLGTAGVRWASLFMFGNITLRKDSTQITFGASDDLIIGWSAAATLRHGAADAASPIAQTIKFQSVVAGTSNTAGVTSTFQASAGTGTGNSGGFAFQIAPAGSTGSTQNSFVTVLSVGVDGNVIIDQRTGAVATQSLSVKYQGTTKFYVSSTTGDINPSGDLAFQTATSQINFAGNAIIRSNVANTIQFGAADAASPVAQGTRVQSVVAGTADTAGANWTFRASLSTGSGTSGSILFQTGGTGAGSTAQNTAVTALTLAGGTQLATFAGQVVITNIATDAAHTDATVCIDTTSKQLLIGSGTLGVCLGTSSARYKDNIVPLQGGLEEVLRLHPVAYRYKPGYGDGGAREQGGFLAEELIAPLPKLVALDAKGLPNSVDMLGVTPYLVNAIKELTLRIENLQADNDNMRADMKRRASR